VELCFIVPINFLEEFATRGKYHLVLVHICQQSKKYKDFYKERRKMGDFVILDNSVYELEKPIEDERLVDIACDLNANEIILPDYPENVEKTLKISENFLSRMAKNNMLKKFQYALVIQGKRIKDVEKTIKFLLEVEECKTLCFSGIPLRMYLYIVDELEKKNILYVPRSLSFTMNHLYSRVALYFFLKKEGYIERLRERGKKIHILGLTDGIELLNYAKEDVIRSCDSSSAFVHGYHYIAYTYKGLPGEKLSVKLDFFTKNINNLQRQLIEHNIKMLKIFAKGVDYVV